NYETLRVGWSRSCGTVTKYRRIWINVAITHKQFRVPGASGKYVSRAMRQLLRITLVSLCPRTCLTHRDWLTALGISALRRCFCIPIFRFRTRRTRIVPCSARRADHPRKEQRAVASNLPESFLLDNSSFCITFVMTRYWLTKHHRASFYSLSLTICPLTEG